jgi:hypothetical protein
MLSLTRQSMDQKPSGSSIASLYIPAVKPARDLTTRSIRSDIRARVQPWPISAPCHHPMRLACSPTLQHCHRNEPALSRCPHEQFARIAIGSSGVGAP